MVICLEIFSVQRKTVQEGFVQRKIVWYPVRTRVEQFSVFYHLSVPIIHHGRIYLYTTELTTGPPTGPNKRS